MKSVINEDKKKEIISLFNDGESGPTICHITKISSSTLDRFLRKNNLLLSKRQHKKNRENYDYDSEINKKYNHLLIVGKKFNNKAHTWHVETKCDCGNITYSTLRNVKSGYKKTCGKNNCEYHHKIQIQNARCSNFTGYEEIGGMLWSSYKLGAIRRNIKFDLNIKDVWNLFLKQNRRCKLTNIKLKLHYKNKTASLDRIDSSKGYNIKNVQWLHKDVNKMKMDLKQEDFIQYCQLIAKNN